MMLSLGTRHDPAPDRAFRNVELRRLEWDTAFFGRKMGVLDLNGKGQKQSADRLAADLQLALREASEDGYAHVILRLTSDRANAIRAAESAGLHLVDTALDLVMRSRETRPFDLGTVRSVTEHDIEALREIAADAFPLGRFAADPFFSSAQVAALYRQWITNLCTGGATQVLVAEASDEVAGFVSCVTEATGEGRIPLLATSEAHRRQGVGRALVGAALRWFASAGAREVFVKTQASNYPALALYQQFGFAIARSELTFSRDLLGREGFAPRDP